MKCGGQIQRKFSTKKQEKFINKLNKIFLIDGKWIDLNFKVNSIFNQYLGDFWDEVTD